jgi:hypothetical protein
MLGRLYKYLHVMSDRFKRIYYSPNAPFERLTGLAFDGFEEAE